MDATDLAFAGPARQAELVRSGEVSARELVGASLERIRALDGRLNAFRVVLEEEALAAAERIDAGEGDADAPLLGVPVAVKDDQGVAGQVRAFGSNAHDWRPEPEDWAIVRRLREAGAVIVGITNVPELTITPFTESAAHGTTRNPWALDRTPGGSSGGSAAAVAAGLVATGTASDGGGSIRIPAAYCGLVGLKPQNGRQPFAFPPPWTWHGLETMGVLTRTVADAALVYDALTGEPWREAPADRPGRSRIALSFKVPPGLISKVAPEVRRAVEQTAETLRSLGHEVVERDPDYGLASLAFTARYLRGIHDEAHAMPHFDRLEPRTRGYARLGALVGRRGLRRAMEALPEQRRRINAIFSDVDALLGPATATPAVPVGKYTGRSAWSTFNGNGRDVPFTAIWNHTGNPAISVPAGFTAEGVPLAAQLVGPFDAEPRLLALAAQIEEARPWADQRPPLAG